MLVISNNKQLLCLEILTNYRQVLLSFEIFLIIYSMVVQKFNYIWSLKTFFLEKHVFQKR